MAARSGTPTRKTGALYGSVMKNTGASICLLYTSISNEGVSLLENAGHIGLPIPEKLKEVLAQLHNRAEDDKDTEDKE